MNNGIVAAMCSLSRALQDPLFRDLAAIDIALNWAINYQLPKSTIYDHLIDCFGFMVTP